MNWFKKRRRRLRDQARGDAREIIEAARQDIVAAARRETAENDLPSFVDARLRDLVRFADSQGIPNREPLWELIREIGILRLNVKNMGYDLARSLHIEDLNAPAQPPAIRLGWRTSTQSDIESDWLAYWCQQIKIRRLYHRKVWELCYVLQGLHAHGAIARGARGLAFGAGTEPLPSYLASRGVAVLATDLPLSSDVARTWHASNQHAGTVAGLFKRELVDRHSFEQLVSYRHVDMRHIPGDLRDFDFCWSICALEHLGTIEKGLRFVENAMATLKPGGVAVHTTELNINDSGPALDNSPTVLFQRRHFEALEKRLSAAGYLVGPISFDVGVRPMDRFIDVPPYDDLPSYMSDAAQFPAHLKLSIDGIPATCFGLTIRKPH